MTTIAYRDGVLAADSRVTECGVVVGEAEKITRAGPGWLAMSGAPSDLLEIAEWLNKWPETEAPPDRLKGYDCCGLFVLPDGVAYQAEGARLWIMRAPFFAVGSGSHFALAAMHMGADAVRAVEVAAAFDGQTGLPVQSVRVS